MPGSPPGGGDDAAMGLAEGAMDDDHDLPARFRLPESFAESGDPISANPFPLEHPAHQAWITATHEAEIVVSRINAEAAASLTPATADDWMLVQVVAKFDAWAGRGVQFVLTDNDVRGFDIWLVAYGNAWIESLLLRAPLPPIPLELFLAELHRRLGARVHHWKAEARRYRATQEAQSAAGRSAPELHPPPSDAVIERRRNAVQRYRQDHELTAPGLARAVGVSETGITGIVREDWTRFSRATQDKLLTAIGITREDWYRE
jgi:hypothetical protein